PGRKERTPRHIVPRLSGHAERHDDSGASPGAARPGDPRPPGRHALSFAYRLARRLAGRGGVDLLRRRYYSPVPRLAELPAGFWSRESPLRAVDFDLAGQLAFVETELGPYLAEFDPPLESMGVPDE